MIKVPKIATGIRLPEPIMQVIDVAAARWMCDRGQAMTRIVQEWDELKVIQLPLAALMPSQPETEAEQMRRLKVQELPGFIPNDLIPPFPAVASVPSPIRVVEPRHLGTGPGDEVDEEGADGDL